MSGMGSSWSVAAELSRKGEPFVMVTLLSSRGHAPQDPGAKALVTREGLRAGTVGGGKVEARAIREAQALLESGEACAPKILTWNLQKDIGMTCGGEVTYLFETVRTDQWPVWIFGAGHVAQALVRALLPLEVQVVCVDSRPEWVEKLPKTERLHSEVVTQPKDWLDRASGREFFVVVTQGHATDVPVLQAIFERFPQPVYVGAIGSETKGLKIKSELRALGVSEESLAALRIPIGLPLGSNHPGEIAVSILAELIQVRDQKKNAPTSGR